MKIRESTSVYIDYAKCILVPEKFGAYVVVAKTGNLGDTPCTQERTQINAQKKGVAHERIAIQDSLVSQERSAPPDKLASQERFAPKDRLASQERLASKAMVASQERNGTSGKCPEEVTNGAGKNYVY